MIQHRKHLSDQEQEAVLALISEAAEHDGIPPIAEHIVLHLRHGGDMADKHLLIFENNEVVAYAHIDETDLVAGSSAELVVHPKHRGHGLGRALLQEICSITSPRLWSHGDLSAARQLAADYGLTRGRTVLQMRRSLTQPLPTQSEKIQIRAFVPGQDNQAWLVVNNRAFQGHPEQGDWTVENLEQRMQETWFDPAGFLLAIEDGGVAAYCWTKIHGARVHSHDGQGEHGHEPIGEIYAMGVDPAHQQQGLGRAVTIAGLAHLRRKGLMSAMLYVDAENTRAIELYKELGFTEWGRDVMYRMGPCD